MKISSSGIVDGVIQDIYGKRSRHIKMGMPTYSLPIKIENDNKATKSYVIVLDDPDAMEVCGKVFIHWLVCDLQKKEIKENESFGATEFIQGKNDWGENCYGGMAPPNKPHSYRITVYALDTLLGLHGDFTLDVLEKAMEGHILDSDTIYGLYSNK